MDAHSEAGLYGPSGEALTHGRTSKNEIVSLSKDTDDNQLEFQVASGDGVAGEEHSTMPRRATGVRVRPAYARYEAFSTSVSGSDRSVASLWV